MGGGPTYDNILGQQTQIMGSKTLSVQHIPNLLNNQVIDLPMNVIKPLRNKQERVASAHHNSQVIKKLHPSNKNINFRPQVQQQAQFNNNFFDEPNNLPHQTLQLDMGSSQAKKFFNEGIIKPSTAGQISRKNYKKNNIYQCKNEKYNYVKQEDDILDELDRKEDMIQDFQQIAENNRAQTAGYRKQLNRMNSIDNPERMKLMANTQQGFHINRVHLEDQGEEYATFKINKDVRSHLTKYQQGGSHTNLQSAYSKQRTTANTYKSNKKINPYQIQKGQFLPKAKFFPNKQQYQQQQFDHQNDESGSINESQRSRQGLQTAQPNRRRTSQQKLQNFDINNNNQQQQRPNTHQNAQRRRNTGNIPQKYNNNNNIQNDEEFGQQQQQQQKTFKTPQERIEELYGQNGKYKQQQQKIKSSGQKPPLYSNDKNMHQLQDFSVDFEGVFEDKDEDFNQNQQKQQQQYDHVLQSGTDFHYKKSRKNLEQQSNLDNSYRNNNNSLLENNNNNSFLKVDSKQNELQYSSNNKKEEKQYKQAQKVTKQVGSVKFDVSIKKTKKPSNSNSHNNSNSHLQKSQQQSKIQLKNSNQKLKQIQQNNSINNNRNNNNNNTSFDELQSNNNVLEELGFDIEHEGVTESELTYMQKQMELQNQFEKKHKITKESMRNLNVVSIQTSEKVAYNPYDDIEIIQEANNKADGKDFYDTEKNIREDLIQMGEEFKEKFKKYVQEDEKLFNEIEEDQLNELEFLNADGKHLSEYEIQLINNEYKKDINQRDYNQLDAICSKLKFFTQFTRPTRIYLLKLANIQFYPSDVNIFEQGDEGDLMYIIIKGGCHVRIKKTNLNGEVENPVFVTLYDGAQFGELALQAANKKPKGILATLMGQDTKINSLKDVRNVMEQDRIDREEEEAERKRKLRQQKDDNKSDLDDDISDLQQKQEQNPKRAATIQTCESTICFTISRDQYKTIIVNMMKKDLDAKLKVLQTLSFFDCFNSVSLMTLAKHIEVQKFQLGEVILKEDTIPQYFYIISKGRVRILKEEMFIRKNTLLGLAKDDTKKRLNFGALDYKNVVKNKPVRNHQINKFEEIDEDFDSDEEIEQIRMKAEQYKKIYQNEEKCMFKYQFDFGSMARSEYFMGRSFISEYLKLDPKFEQELQGRKVQQNARLTIVADSAEVEIYRIDKMKIYELPVFLRKAFIDGLVSKKEYDWAYDETYKLNLKDKKVLKNEKIEFNQFMMANFGQQWVKEWEKFKSDIIKDHLTTKIMKKNQFNKV